MSRHLPARPNLEHLRTQAKALLTKLREGDAQAAQTFAEYLPEAATLSPEQIRQRGFCAQDRIRAMARPGSTRRPPAEPGRHVGLSLT